LIDNGPCLIVLRVVKDSNTRILNFIRERKTKDENQRDWQAKENKKGLPVTQQVEEFFLYEKQKLLHSYSVGSRQKAIGNWLSNTLCFL